MGFRGLSKSERLIIKYIESHLTDPDGDLDEEIEERIEQLEDALQEAGFTIDDLASNLDILDLVLYGNFDEIIEYIKRRKILLKDKNARIICILESYKILSNNREKKADEIIEILEKEGLLSVLTTNPNNRKILYEAEPQKVKENLAALKKVNNYKELIVRNPNLIYKSNINEINKLIENMKIDSKGEQKGESKEENENSDDINSVSQEKEKIDEHLKNDGEETSSKEEKVGYEYLGEEPEILKLKEVLKFYMIPISILSTNPEICYRVTKCNSTEKLRQIKNISSILRILSKNGIPFSILEKCPNILILGSKGKIEAIIRELREQQLSIDIILLCPEILLKSSPEKINNVIEKISVAGLDKRLIYSCPQVLISQNVNMFIEVVKKQIHDIPNISAILGINLFVHIDSIQQEYLKYDMTSTYMNKKVFKENKDTIYIKNILDVQERIDMLRQQQINIENIKEDKQIFVLGDKEEIKSVIIELQKIPLEENFIEKNASLTYLVVAQDIKEITETLKEYRPDTYTDVINKIPEVYQQTDVKSIKKVFKTIDELGIRYIVIDQEPQILLRRDFEEVNKVVDNLTQKHDITIEQIENNPRILSEGKEKYIDRNFETFKRNNINIPFQVIFTKSARNNEKNIDTLIENGLYEYINPTPEILDVEHVKVVQYIRIAKKEDIPLIVRNNQKEKVLNMEYFRMTPMDVSEEYGIDINDIEKERQDFDRRPLRRVANPKLYLAVLPQIMTQADSVLEEYINDDVSYKRHEQVVSKQKVVREAYIDLERESLKRYNMAVTQAISEKKDEKEATKFGKKEAKKVMQMSVINNQLDKTLERLTRKNEHTTQEKSKREIKRYTIMKDDKNESKKTTELLVKGKKKKNELERG